MKRKVVDEFDAGLPSEGEDLSSASSNESFDLEAHPITSEVTSEPVKKEKNVSTGGRLKSTLFVRNLPFDCSNQQLEEFFSKLGPLRSAFVVKGEDEKSKGFGFVQFALPEDAEKAIASLSTPGGKFAGRRLKAELAVRKHVQLDAKVLRQKEKTVAPSAKSWAKASGPTRCFLLHLSAEHKDITKKILYKRVRKAGPLVELLYPFEGDERVAKCVFEKVPFAHKALRRLDGHVFKGHTIKANFYPDGEVSLKAKATVAQSTKAHRLIVRNLPFTIKREQLEEAFKAHGAVEEVTIPVKPDGKIKGFAFVQYSDAADAAMAMKAINGTELAGRLVAVDWALGKKQYETLKAQEEGSGSDEEEVKVVDSSESEDDDEEVDVVSTKEVAKEKPEVSDDAVVFIRNLSFETTQEGLQSFLESEWGALNFCRLVRVKETGASRGTAFASFKDAASAQRLCEASKSVQQDDLEDNLEELKRKRTGKNFHSLLDQSEGGSGVVLDGRALLVVPAVKREEAKELKKGDTQLIPAHDQRCLALIDEVLIPEGSKFWPKVECKAREEVAQARKKELKKNPNLMVSPVRLVLRHLPATLQEADLKKLMQEAHKLATPHAGRLLSDQPKAEDGSLPAPRLRQVKIVKGEGEKSRGYAFCQWSHHRHALLVVRYLVRQQPNLWLRLFPEAFNQRSNPHARIVPLVEFATEKRAVLAKRKERLAEQKQQAQQVTKAVKPKKPNKTAKGGKNTERKAPAKDGKKPVKAVGDNKKDNVIPVGKRRRHR